MPTGDSDNASGPAPPLSRGTIGELFWNIADAVLICDDGGVLHWNPAAEGAFGVAEADNRAFDLTAAFGEAEDALRLLLKEGGTAELDCAGGCGRRFAAHAWHLNNQPSEPSVCVLRDITTERRYVTGLHRLNQLARELVATDSVDLPIQRIVDEAKAMTSARFSALIVLREGTTDEIKHFAYHAPRDLFPARLPRVVGLLAVPIQTGAPARLDDIRGHPAGNGIPVRHPPIAALIAVPLIVGGAVVGELAVANGPDDPTFDEIDEALLVELAGHVALGLTLSAARAETREAEEEQRALTTLALHNIRTPLTVAKGFLSTLRSRYDELTPELRSDAYSALGRALDRIHGLSEGALLQEHQPLTPAPPVLSELQARQAVERLFATVGSIAPAVRLGFSQEPDTPDTFITDPSRFGEILTNLLTNALRFSPRGGTVTVTHRAEGRSVRFDVTDSGPGIAASMQSRLFDAPDAGHPGLRRGRGLWLVRKRVEELGGTVGVTSRVNEGSTFWFTLPGE